MARPPRGGTPATPGTPGGTPGTPQQPVKWGAIDLPVIAGRLGIAPDSSAADVADALARMNVTPQQMAQFVLDGQSALDFIDGNTPTVNNLDPNAAATDVDLDDAEPSPKRMMTPEELEAFGRAWVSGAGSGATRDLEFTGGGIRIKGTYRRPPPEVAEGEVAPAGGGKRGGKGKKAPPPKKGDPGYFKYQDEQADRWWRENLGMNPPVGARTARKIARNAGSIVTAPAILGGLGYAGYQGVKAALPYIQGMLPQGGDQQGQGQFRRPGDDQLLQQQDMELQGVPADAAPADQPTMQAPPNDNAAALLMRIRQSRSI